MESVTQNLKSSGPLQKIATGIGVFLSVCLIAVLGYMAAGWALMDSLYMVIITIFGVGYGEVHPIETTSLRILTILVIIAGYAAVIYTVGGFMQLVLDGELRNALGARRMSKEIDLLHGHTIICGMGRLGSILASELQAQSKSFVVIDKDLERLQAFEEHGYLTIHGDATEEEILERAGVRKASSIASVLALDTANVFVTITARDLNPGIIIIARGENPSTEKKLLGCGANKVVLPAAIGAEKVAQLILRPHAEDLIESLKRNSSITKDLWELGLEFNEFHVQSDSAITGLPIKEIESDNATAFLAVAVRSSDGEINLHPLPETILNVGDTIIFLGHSDCFPQLTKRLSSQSADLVYRGVRSRE